MFRPCGNLLKSVSLSTVERLTKRTLLTNGRELTYEFQQPSLSPVYYRTRIGQRSNFSTASPSESASSEKTAQEESGGQVADKQTEELQAAIKEYKEKLLATEDKYKRQLAETENVRQRFMRQIDEAKSFGIQNFCKDLLEIADTLELATESVPKDALSKGDPALKQLYDGLTMTQSNLTKIFNKHGLVAVRPLGEKFNPNIHEAVFQVQDKSKAAGSIANVVKIGYTLHDRLIRPAKVGVYISS